ncbi:decaprenyl-phosphate phosphoribosyltransferase [Planomonospora parontospora]|uniref:decaprenyl-phosphate phosphoribosyltransferase n=1 Tax=Planomonospora parontospora TaxID=58119 RepID=UPI00167063FE|nr:decaprenyl-phosphate phosphoribosyltransferase [Planomonospora parontospora]GGL08355.1 decaprenyl-phosphate phosphoribosyltransferase [Planomonospora parontospora subsp. antibiotica]GII14545.1 decaprenyl-phosphate phosphoribosyltransferase [Planomonospora parontospora subsp. antibiotica]
MRPPADPPAAVRAHRGFSPVALLRACRPRQWLKNALVFAAPAAAGVLGTAAGLRGALVAFAAFCLAASGAYLLNDAADVEADRRHPRKRFRPVAAGLVPVALARAAGILLVLLAPAVAALPGDWRLPAVVAGYLALTFSYTFWLKHQPVVDLVAVAGCHVIRAFAGAIAVDVPVTSWFLVVVSLGSLQLVAGKREAEVRAAAENATGNATRAILAAYTPSYLAQVRTMSSGAMIVTYCLWALNDHPGGPFYAMSIVPFVLIVLRHNLLVDRGIGEEPEELALRDRPIQLFIAALVALLTIGIYLT